MRADMMSNCAPSGTAANTIRRRLTLTVSVLAGILFASAGTLKLFSYQPFLVYYEKWGQPHWVFFGTGVVELIAGIALFVPSQRIPAAWTLLGAIFLVCWHPWTISDPLFIVAQSASILMLLLLIRLPIRNER